MILSTDLYLESSISTVIESTDIWESLPVPTHETVDFFTDVWRFSAHPIRNLLFNVFLVFADLDGDVQTYNVDTSDNGAPIYYELETREQEFGNRNHLKKISDQIVVFCRDGNSSSLQVIEGRGDAKQVQLDLSRRVNIGPINLEGNYFTFRWFGVTDSESPVLEGFQIENITDLGLTHG